jgi:hypothetical protein
LLAGRALENLPSEDEGTRKDLVLGILNGEHPQSESTNDDTKPSGFFALFRPRAILNMFTSASSAGSSEQQKNAQSAFKVDDTDFLAAIPSVIEQEPLLASVGEEVIEHVYSSLRRATMQTRKALVRDMKVLQERECKNQFTREANQRKEKHLTAAYNEFVEIIYDAFTSPIERYPRHIFTPSDLLR